MAPAHADSTQILAQAAKQLQDVVKETGSTAGPYAIAILELIECTAKLQEFDAMATSAEENAATSEEAQTWREISLMTLQYCRQNLVEQQRAGVAKVCQLAGEGASFYHPLAAAETPATEVAGNDTKTRQDEAASPKAVLRSPTLDMPQSPPGCWAIRPPPGLDLPAAYDAESAEPEPKSKVAAPPGFNSAMNPGQINVAKKRAPPSTATQSKTVPWRASPNKAAPKAAALEAPASRTAGAYGDVGMLAANLDAYSDEE